MKKVLLVCFDNVGDLVFASALAKALTAEPGLSLSLLCKDYTAKIGYLLPGVDQVFAADPYWDKAPNRKKGKLAQYVRCLTTVRAQRFDEAYIVGHHWQSALSLRLIGIPKIFAFKGRKNSLFLSRALPLPSREVPVVEGILRSFRSEVPASVPAHTELRRSALPQFELPVGLRDKRIVLLHAFAGNPRRCAPLSLWGELARELGSRGYHIVWAATSAEAQTIRRAFPSEWGDTHFLDLWAPDLLHLAWLSTKAELFIGHDSGPLHVANGLGAPVLGLFLPSEPLRTFPQGPGPSRMIHKANAADLSVGEVIEAALSLLNGRVE